MSAPAEREDVEICETALEKAVHARIPGGSEVWWWIGGGGDEPKSIHREIVTAAVRAYLLANSPARSADPIISSASADNESGFSPSPEKGSL